MRKTAFHDEKNVLTKILETSIKLYAERDVKRVN